MTWSCAQGDSDTQVTTTRTRPKGLANEVAIGFIALTCTPNITRVDFDVGRHVTALSQEDICISISGSPIFWMFFA